MKNDFRHAIQETARYLMMAARALQFWRRPPPVTTVDELKDYVGTRSKFVAQTTLYGYIKTRAGTRYVSLFEDDVFSNSVNIAKWEIYLACLCDLAVYAAARTGRISNAEVYEMRELAVKIVESALRDDGVPPERPQGFDDIEDSFRTRATEIAWFADFNDDEPFVGSLDALVHWAPVADELKMLDAEIVRTSMRNKWKKVLDQFDSIHVPDAVMSDWRTRG